MPVVDMPLEKLREYTGTNPMPSDFDLFWDERLKEVNNYPLNYKVEKSEIQGYDSCEYYDLWFDGIDGGKIYTKYLHPKSEEKFPLILQFHGYPGASRSWFEQSSFAGMGCAIIAMDCPGQGGKGDDIGGINGTTVAGHIVAGLDDEPKKMYYVRLFQNTSILCRIVQQLEGIDINRIYANGASQGVGIALACTSLNKIIKRCAALYPFLSDYKRVWDMDLDMIAYQGLRYYSKWFDPMQKNQDEDIY